MEYYTEDETGAYVLDRIDKTHSAPEGTEVTAEVTPEPDHHTYDADKSSTTVSGIVTKPTTEDGEVKNLLTLKVYYKWDSHSVTFNSDGGTAIEPLQVKHGQTAAEPTAPTRSGYRFDGWYNGDTAYDFSGAVTDDLTLTAHWTRRSGSTRYTVTVEDAKNGGVTASAKSASRGTTVTVTVTPDADYTLGSVTVKDAGGSTVTLTPAGGGKYTFTMPRSSVTVSASFVRSDSKTGFDDVADDSYYADAVEWAVDKGITGGISSNLFGPDLGCTRAQIVTFLWRSAGSPEPRDADSFDDVAADAYYAKAVAWAVENGITAGTGGVLFSPDLICTRAQAVTFLYRVSGSPAVSGSGIFRDVAADAYYAAAVQWAEENGITDGIGDGLFGPDLNCTRAQIVTFLYHFMK